MDESSSYDHLAYLSGMEDLKQGRTIKAAICMHRLARAHPENIAVREALGRALLSLGLVFGAARVFGEIVTVRPIEDYAHYCLGRSYESLGETVLARRHYRLACALNPQNPHYALRRDLILWTTNN